MIQLLVYEEVEKINIYSHFYQRELKFKVPVSLSWPLISRKINIKNLRGKVD